MVKDYSCHIYCTLLDWRSTPFWVSTFRPYAVHWCKAIDNYFIWFHERKKGSFQCFFVSFFARYTTHVRYLTLLNNVHPTTLLLTVAMLFPSRYVVYLLYMMWCCLRSMENYNWENVFCETTQRRLEHYTTRDANNLFFKAALHPFLLMFSKYFCVEMMWPSQLVFMHQHCAST